MYNNFDLNKMTGNQHIMFSTCPVESKVFFLRIRLVRRLILSISEWSSMNQFAFWWKQIPNRWHQTTGAVPFLVFIRKMDHKMCLTPWKSTSIERGIQLQNHLTLSCKNWFSSLFGGTNCSRVIGCGNTKQHNAVLDIIKNIIKRGDHDNEQLHWNFIFIARTNLLLLHIACEDEQIFSIKHIRNHTSRGYGFIGWYYNYLWKFPDEQKHNNNTAFEMHSRWKI